MQRIAVVIGHPRPASLNHALAERYAQAARDHGADVRIIDLATSNFPLSTADAALLQVGGPDDLERLGPDLADMARTVLWAEHLLIVHPVWWGTYPAVLKGFIDRVFLSGIAFKYRARGAGWDRLLAGRTARIIYTMDAPRWFNRLKYRRPGEMSLRNPLLWYCGIRTLGSTSFGPVRGSSSETRERWLVSASEHGRKDAQRSGKKEVRTA